MIPTPPADPQTPASDESPAESAASTPAESRPVPEENLLSTVDITLDLKPGERLQITVEAMPLDAAVAQGGEAEQPRVVVVKTGQSQTIPAQPQEGTTLPQAEREIDRPTQPLPPQIERETQPLPANAVVKGRGDILSSLRGVRLPNFLKGGMALFILALVVYLVTRLIGLADFPIYFFCDEAASPNLAADLVRDDFKGYDGQFLPTYFRDGSGPYSLSTTVYIQLLPYLLFGHSVWATRATEVLIGLLAALWLGLMMRDIFKLSFWWSGPLLLALVPTWFLHSRIAFGYSIMVTFYTGFLYYYLLYRTRDPRYLYPALVLGALTFYTYMSGQPIMVATGILLFIIDIRYHWKQRRTALWGLGLLVLLVLPQVRFMLTHQGDYQEKFAMYTSYLVSNLPLAAKLGTYLNKYLAGLNPLFWFVPNDVDLAMYTMKGYANIHWILLPFIVMGFIQVVRSIRSAQSRVVLAMLLAAPTGAALVDLAARRALTMVIPMVLLAGIGVTLAMEWAEKKRWLPRWASILAVVLVLTVGSFAMLRDALVNGPTWYNDYGMSGLQYGSRQVITAAKQYQTQHPGTKVHVTLSWTFQADLIQRFFLNNDPSIIIDTPDRYLRDYNTANEGIVFFLAAPEYQQVLDSGKFKEVHIEETLPYPDGTNGFYLVTLHYRDDIQAVLATEKEQHRALRSDTLTLLGQTVTVNHSLLEGEIGAAFDGSRDTLIKTQEVNPMVLEIVFPQAVSLSAVKALVGSGHTQITLYVQTEPDFPLKAFTQEAGITSDLKEMTIPFGETLSVTKLRFELLEMDSTDSAIVHLWDLTLVP